MKPVHLKSGVTENILSSMYDVDPRLTYRQLNKQVYNESGLSFYKKNCDKPLTPREIINYINTNPKKMGIVYLDENEDVDFFEVGVKFLYLNKFFLQQDGYSGENNMFKTQLREEYVLKNRVDTWGTPDTEMIINIINDNFVTDYDLLTIYNVYKNRGDCMRVNKNYAKEKTLSILDNNTATSKDSLFKIYYCYEYLILNCFMFDIPYKYKELDDLALKYETPVISIMNFTGDIVLNHIQQAMDKPENSQLYNTLKQFMLKEIERITPSIIKHIQNM